MFQQLNTFPREQIAEFRAFALQNKQNIDLVTSQLLLTMGFKLQHNGSSCLREAILYCYGLPEDVKANFSGEVYPYVAEKFHTMSRNVDHNIRTAIRSCYYTGNMFALNSITGYTVVFRQYPPTSIDLILQIVRWLHLLQHIESA